MNLDPNVPLDTVFVDNEIERAEETIDDALVDLDIRNGNTVQKMDHTTILSRVGGRCGMLERENERGREG